MDVSNNPQLRDPHLTYPDHDFSLGFNDYISACQQIIVSTRPDLQQAHPSAVVLAANSPFALQPAQSARCGVLLIHGLYDSPFILRDLGNALQQQGLLAHSLLLPGHGTVPGALLNIQLAAWQQAVRYGIHSLAPHVEKIFLMGFSLGGALALQYLLAAETQHNIAGAILLAPALKVSALAPLAGILPKLGKAWMQIDAELNYAKYSSFTYRSGYETYRLTQQIAAQTKTLNCPLFFSLSAEDETVQSDFTLNYFHMYANAASELIYYGEKSFSDKRVTLRPTVYPELGIEGFSHICLPVAPDNAHYGMTGDYIYASHLDAIAKARYGAYDNFKRDVNNTLFKYGLRKFKYSRLTYNPDFAYLQERIQQFIHKASVF